MRRTVVLLLLSTVLGVPALSSAQEPGCAWSPDPATTRDAILFGVDSVDASDVWAVGSVAGAGGRERTLVRHWDGTAWETQPSPSVKEQTNRLNDVAALPDGTGWAVGERSRATMKTIVQRYDGTRWRMQRSLNPSKTLNSFDAVDATPEGTVYAAGTRWGRKRQHRMMVQRFDGTSWSVMGLGRPGFLRDVDAITDADAWAVGVRAVDGRLRAYSAHYDGTRWSPVELPPIRGGWSFLNGVSAAATDDVWAAGMYMIADESHPLLLHYDGAAWTTAEVPDEDGGIVELYDVAAADADTAVAVGQRQDDAYGEDTRVVFEWDGTEWREAGLEGGIESSWLNAVDVTPAGDAWAVGYRSRRAQTSYVLRRTCS